MDIVTCPQIGKLDCNSREVARRPARKQKEPQLTRFFLLFLFFGEYREMVRERLLNGRLF